MSHTSTFVSTLTFDGAVFILYFTPAEGGGYHITCLNDKSVNPMHIVKREDGTWHLTGLPGIITPLITQKISAIVQEHEQRQ